MLHRNGVGYSWWTSVVLNPSEVVSVRALNRLSCFLIRLYRTEWMSCSVKK